MSLSKPNSFSQRLAVLFGRNNDGREEKSSAISGLIALQQPGQPVWTPRDYAALARNGYSRNVIAYRCIRMISEAAASVPLQLLDKGAPLSQHPVLTLLARPNPDQSGGDLLQDLYGFIQSSSNAYLEAVRIGDSVKELYALRPDRM